MYCLYTNGYTVIQEIFMLQNFYVGWYVRNIIMRVCVYECMLMHSFAHMSFCVHFMKLLLAVLVHRVSDGVCLL